MKNYLSYGGGVNSTALLLLMHEQGIEHEAVFVDHGGDWPETYEYVEMLRQKYPITVLKPEYKRKGEIINNIYDYCDLLKLTPSKTMRWCTRDFKVAPIHRYINTPCFMHLGIDFDESHRAKISSENEIENRYLLIENEINRQGCIDLIKKHGLPIPIKSGCFFCPFQQIKQWKELRTKHPDLWCKAVSLEKQHNNRAIADGVKSKYKNPGTLRMDGKLLTDIIDERQKFLIPEFEYPPCQCGL